MDELRLDEETRKKLVGLMPFSQDATDDFIPEIYDQLDIKKEFKPVFKMRAFNAGEKAEIKRAGSDITDKQWRDYARRVIKDISPLFDVATGEPVPFETDKNGWMRKELMEKLQQDVVLQLYRHALKLSSMLYAEGMGLKSLPPSTSE